MADSDEIEIEAAEPSADDPRDEEKPRGRTSMMTMLLIVLNFLGMAGFAVMLYMDLGTRTEWTKAVFLRDLAMRGLPFDEKDTRVTADSELHLRHELDPPQVKQAYKDRGGPAADKFLAVSETFSADIRFADLDENLLAAYFRDGGAGTPVVATLEAEVKRIKTALPNEIDSVAREVADKVKGKPASDKRDLAKKILFPICTDGSQVLALQAKIYDEQKTPDNKLNEFLVEAAQRRMYFDILQALEVFRPMEKVDPPDPEKVADPKFKKLLVDRAADVETVKIDDLRQLFAKRCDDILAARDWIYPGIERPNFERRRCAAFLMVTISQVEMPAAGRPQAEPPKDGADKKAAKDKTERPFAFPKAKRRAEVVCGLRDFNEACQDLTVVTEILENQMVETIRRDIGSFRLPLTTRIYYPKKFAEQLVAVMKKMNGVSMPDEAAFQSSVEERLKKVQGKIDGSETLLVELKALMAEQNVRIAEDPKVPGSLVNKTAFESAVDGLLDANAIGFLGKYQASLKRIQDLALLVDIRKRQYDELKINEAAEDSQLKSRIGHEDGILKDLVKARAKTRELAEALQLLQQELFVAQVNLAGVHEYNLYLAERVKQLEKKAKSGAGK